MRVDENLTVKRAQELRNNIESGGRGLTASTTFVQDCSFNFFLPNLLINLHRVINTT